MPASKANRPRAERHPLAEREILKRSRSQPPKRVVPGIKARTPVGQVSKYPDAKPTYVSFHGRQIYVKTASPVGLAEDSEPRTEREETRQPSIPKDLDNKSIRRKRRPGKAFRKIKSVMSATMHDAVPNYLDLVRLDGRGIVVLGGGEGIGRQVCHALSQAGGRVLCVDREEELARKVAEEVGGDFHRADITVRSEMEGVFARAKVLFGQDLKGVVDVVGVAFVMPIEEIDDAIWNAQIDIVLRHAFLTLQIGGPTLSENGGGAVTFVGSVSGISSIGGQSLYGSAKAALHHLVKCGANEFGSKKVRVNLVAPSFVRTPRLNEKLGPAAWERMAGLVPLGRVSVPSEIAAPILFLQSDLAQFVSGVTLPVDGGLTAVSPLAKF